MKLFRFKPDWNGKPETFLVMAIAMQSQTNNDYSVEVRWGEVMQNVVKVNRVPNQKFANFYGMSYLMFNGRKV